MTRQTRLMPRRDQTRRTPVRSSRPTLEGLEDRYLLSSLEGGQWTYGSRITYSFMPDGTNVGGVPSTLYQTMNAGYSTTAWQQAIEKAAAIWEQVANINLALVSDNGEPTGSSGNQQDDPNVGDIRIGSIPEGNNQLAFTLLPPPINGGTDAGDVFFNSSQTWGSRGYDLETVAVHELGHALGLGESAVQNAVMYTYYQGVNTTLSTDDISAVQSLYGAVPSDPTPNWNALFATNITPLINGNGQLALSGVSIHNSSDYDWYSVTVPSNTTGNMVVTMQSSNLSSLSPRLTIYNGLTLGLGQSIAPNTYGATVSYTVNNVHPGQVYFIRAGAANTGPGSDGAYGVLVNFGSQSQAPIAPPNTVVASQPDQGGGSENLLTNGPARGGSNDGGTSASNWWNNWLSRLSQVEPGLGRFQIGSFQGWGDSLSIGTGAGRSFHAADATSGTGFSVGNQSGAGVVLGGPGDSGDGTSSGAAVPIVLTPQSATGSSNWLLTALDDVLNDWSGKN